MVPGGALGVFHLVQSGISCTSRLYLLHLILNSIRRVCLHCLVFGFISSVPIPSSCCHSECQLNSGGRDHSAPDTEEHLASSPSQEASQVMLQPNFKERPFRDINVLELSPCLRKSSPGSAFLCRQTGHRPLDRKGKLCLSLSPLISLTLRGGFLHWTWERRGLDRTKGKLCWSLLLM